MLTTRPMDVHEDTVFTTIGAGEAWAAVKALAAKGDPAIVVMLARSRDAVQRLRIAMGNRLDRYQKGEANLTPEAAQVAHSLWSIAYAQEKAYDRLIADGMSALAAQDRFVARLLGVRGVGPALAAQLLYYAQWPGRFPAGFDTVSKFWRWCGFAVFDGRAERRTEGQKLHYVSGAKVTMFRIFNSWIKLAGRVEVPYATFYRAQLERYREKYRNEGRPHAAAAAARTAHRKACKLFLAHMWEVARTEAGLPTRPPYALEYLGHSELYTPEQFGW